MPALPDWANLRTGRQAPTQPVRWETSQAERIQDWYSLDRQAEDIRVPLVLWGQPPMLAAFPTISGTVVSADKRAGPFSAAAKCPASIPINRRRDIKTGKPLTPLPFVL